MTPRRVELMGVPIDALTEAQAVERIAAGNGGVVVTPNLDHLRRFEESDTVRRFYAEADLVLADGMPLVWASRIAGTPLPERVAGSNMIWSVSGAAAQRDRSIYLLGGNPGAADGAAEALRARFPGLRVVGTACPPVGFEREPREIEAIAADLAGSGARIVFVGLPLEKQIALVDSLREEFPQTWFLGVGVSFSFVTGEVARAPRLMQRAGLEWVHRLVQEPGRLARRYVLEGIPLGVRLLSSAVATRLRQNGAR